MLTSDIKVALLSSYLEQKLLADNLISSSFAFSSQCAQLKDHMSDLPCRQVWPGEVYIEIVGSLLGKLFEMGIADVFLVFLLCSAYCLEYGHKGSNSPMLRQ